MSAYSLDDVQLVAREYGWEIQQEGTKYYIRSLEALTVLGNNVVGTPSTGPTNHLPHFKTLTEIHHFLTGE